MTQFERDHSDLLLPFLHQLLAIETTDEREALSGVASLIAQALKAEKADVFLLEE